MKAIPNSDVSMWYFDKNNQHLKDMCVLLCQEYSRIVKSNGGNKNKPVRDDTIEPFNELAPKTRVPPLLSYLKYEAKFRRGAVKHQDFDAVLCTALVYIKDSYTERLRIVSRASLVSLVLRSSAPSPRVGSNRIT